MVCCRQHDVSDLSTRERPRRALQAQRNDAGHVGAAMLVPDLRANRPGLPLESSGAERAARTWTPGATRSGFDLPSRVGPALLNGATSRVGRWASYAPTTSGRWPLAIVPVV